MFTLEEWDQAWGVRWGSAAEFASFSLGEEVTSVSGALVSPASEAPVGEEVIALPAAAPLGAEEPLAFRADVPVSPVTIVSAPASPAPAGEALAFRDASPMVDVSPVAVSAPLGAFAPLDFNRLLESFRAVDARGWGPVEAAQRVNGYAAPEVASFSLGEEDIGAWSFFSEPAGVESSLDEFAFENLYSNSTFGFESWLGGGDSPISPFNAWENGAFGYSILDPINILI